ncbi:MAG TPA: tetratricopeptide repeat protein, partial [Trueperaceae bacterium]|nr:tetratricopeptide repeat protein [Trueperaceae bacterium]
MALTGLASVPELADGSMVFADVSGFTSLTSRLVRLLGPRRGAEEVPRYLNRLYDALIAEAERRGGSVIGFAGDAISCWFAHDDGTQAADCALAMQRAMTPFAEIALDDSGLELASLTLKVSVTVGPVRRYVVGDPNVQLIDVVAGDTVSRLEPLNNLAQPGEVVVDELTAVRLDRLAYGSRVIERSLTAPSGAGAFVLDRRLTLEAFVPAAQAQRLGNAPAPRGLALVRPFAARTLPSTDQLRAWLLPNVHRRLQAGRGEFLTELRPVAALFMSFDGIDFDTDPDAGEKLDALLRWVQDEAERVGGTVVQLTTGDKGSYLYMACGAPVSHEDDVFRCATAALHLKDAPKVMSFITRVSIGLGYGTARTGAYGAVSRRTYGALGEETNMAARLMGVAKPGGAYASQAFVRQASEEYEFTELPPVKVKGRSEPVTVYELIGRKGTPTSATRSAAAGPRLIGRKDELAAILAAFADAVAGRGGVVQLTAEAGIGKSHLIAAALAELDPSRAAVVSGASQSFERTTPYRVWRGVFRAVLGVDKNRDVADQLATITAAVTALDPALVVRIPLLSTVLDLPIEENDLIRSLNPELRLASRVSLLVSLLRLHAQRLSALDETLVIVLEDLHWVDPLSVELLVALARVAPTLPLLVLTAGRPEEHHEGRSQSHFLPGAMQLLLGPLRQHEAETLVWERLRTSGASTAAAPTDPATIELIASLVERSEGNPFYLDELVTEFTARGGTDAAAHELPPSLHSLILGRLDRLDEEQQADLKVASVIGRRFQTAWLAACLENRLEPEVVADLEVTTAAQLTTLDARLPLAYRFNHTITHEVTYQSLPFDLKRSLHTRLARHIESQTHEADRPLGLLAFHFDLSNDEQKRREYLWRAGEAAQDDFAHDAAIDYYSRLLPLAGGERLLATRLGLGEVTTFTGAYAEAEEHLRAALTLALQEGLPAGAAKSQRLLGELHERQGDHAGAKQWLEGAVATCRGIGENAELVQVLLALGGNALWHLGEYDEAKTMLREALDLAQTAGDGRATARALHGLANISLYRGEPDAEELYQRSLAIRRDVGDELGVANSLNNLGIIAANGGDSTKGEDLFRQSLAIRRRLGDVSGVAVVVNNLGYMAAERGDRATARRLFDQSLDLRRELGDRLGMAVSLNNLADLARKESDDTLAGG